VYMMLLDRRLRPVFPVSAILPADPGTCRFWSKDTVRDKTNGDSLAVVRVVLGRGVMTGSLCRSLIAQVDFGFVEVRLQGIEMR
jgi:hypothetical protein